MDSPALVGASKLEELRLENCVLGQIVTDLQSRLELAERRTRQAETKCHAASRGGAAAKAPSDEARELQEQLDKLKRRCTNDRVLLEQALRAKEVLEQQAAEDRQRAVEARQQHLEELDRQRQEHLAELERLRQEHLAELGRLREERQAGPAKEREQLTAELQRMRRQLQQLESQSKASPGQAREAELLQAVATESRRAAVAQEGAAKAEGRCRQLEEELRVAQAKLHSASLAHAQPSAMGASGQQQQQRQGGSPAAAQSCQEGQLDLADLGDLESVTLFHCGSPSPARSCAAAGEAARQLSPGVDRLGTAGARALWGEEGCEEGEAESGHRPSPGSQRRQQHCSAHSVEAGLQQQLAKLRRRNTQLQMALADAHMQHAKAQTVLQQEVEVLRTNMAQLKADRDSARRQLGLLQEASAAAQSNEEALLLAVKRLHEEVVEYALRMSQALEQNAALMHEKQVWLKQFESQERDLERCRAELHTARLQQARLLLPAAPQQAEPTPAPGSTDCQALVPSGSNAADPQEELLQALVEAQAQEAALRSVLGEVRREQLTTAQAVGNELRRMHALEKLRLADMREGQRLQRRVGELQKEIVQLYAALAEARVQA